MKLTRTLTIAAIAFAVLTLSAAEKTAMPTPVPALTERVLTETENLKLQLSAAKMELIQKKYKIEDFQNEIKPYADDQEVVATAACESIGIPKALVKTQCGISLGGLTADGKPTPARVWRKKPDEVTAAAK